METLDEADALNIFQKQDFKSVSELKVLVKSLKEEILRLKLELDEISLQTVDLQEVNLGQGRKSEQLCITGKFWSPC